MAAKLSLSATHKIDVLYTPGHASHHVTYFDPQEGIAFAGDTAGIRIDNGPYIMPATPPPDIDLSLWNQSFDAILSRRPAKLLLTHFGFAENPAEHLGTFRERLHHWADITEKILRSAARQTPPRSNPSWPKPAAKWVNTSPTPTPSQYSFTAGLPLSFLGLARHIRKRDKAG